MYISRFLLIVALVLAGCTSTRPPELSYFEVVGTQARRIEVITVMLAKLHELPTPLVDAQFIEEKIGDGELGPADYRAFSMLEVAPEEIAAWQDILTPLAAAPGYASPAQPINWWISEGDFEALQFYAPDTLTGRANGWIAIDPHHGKIYLYSFTT